MSKNKFIFFILLFFVVGCQTTPSKRAPRTAPPAAGKLYSSIQQDMSNNARPRALKKIEKLIQDYPDTDLALEAKMLRGEIYYKSSKYELAYDSFMSVVKSDLFSPREVEAAYWAARSLNSLGRWDEASQLVNKFVTSSGLSKDLLVSIYELKIDLHRKLGEKIEFLRYTVKLEDITDDLTKKEQLRARAFSTVDSSLDIKQLDYIASQSDFRFLRPQAYYSLGSYSIDDKNYSAARDYFLNIIDLFPQSPLVEKAKSYIEQINARSIVDGRTIGIILPLTGKYAQVGRRTLMGIQLGLGVFGNKKSEYRLAVIDSEGNPDSARRAVERLVIEDHVVAIVGSTSSKTALAIASKAHELGVPSIDLSQKNGISQVGDTVFRNTITSEMFVRHLVKTAMEDYNINRFAILYPNDSYGVEYANVFWDEVQRRNGQINGAQPYPHNEKDFKSQIQRLVGTFYIEDRLEEYKSRLKEWEKKQKRVSQRNLPPEDILPPVVDFEALFIPDDITALGQVASMLKYNDVGGIRLLGTNLWNSPAEFFTRGKEFSESSIFVDAYVPKDKEIKNIPFFQEFAQVFGQKPGIFEIQAYDTGKILRTLLDNGISSRHGIASALGSGKEFDGALGKLVVGPNREFSRPIVALTGINGEIQPVPTTRKP